MSDSVSTFSSALAGAISDIRVVWKTRESVDVHELCWTWSVFATSTYSNHSLFCWNADKWQSLNSSFDRFLKGPSSLRGV